MNTRQRFRAALHGGPLDRVPYFEEGIRPEVVRLWRRQGLPACCEPARLFPADRWQRVRPDLEPRPAIEDWPQDPQEAAELLARRLSADDPGRLPREIRRRPGRLRQREHVLLLYVHRGLFQTLGVSGWRRFAEVMLLLATRPQAARRLLEVQADFACRLLERILAAVEVDAAVFSEPIGGNDRPLVSPAMYAEIVLPAYAPILALLKSHGVETIIFQTFANARPLIPAVLAAGFNCLWACEVNIEAMDYRRLRAEHGSRLKLIGGIDLDALRRGKEAIRREVTAKVPPLLAEGGYIPLADGRVRTDVSFENYAFYRHLLGEVIAAHGRGGQFP